MFKDYANYSGFNITFNIWEKRKCLFSKYSVPNANINEDKYVHAWILLLTFKVLGCQYNQAVHFYMYDYLHSVFIIA